MAGNTRRLPSWMLPPPPPPPPPPQPSAAAAATADVQQPTTKPTRGGRRKVTPTNGNATKKRKAAKRDQSPASQASPPAVDVTTPIQPSDEDCSQLLTVEDLVSIAEEYVRAASEEGSKKRNDLQGVVTVNKHTSSATSSSSLLNSTTESIPITVSTTGDAAQDMLHLFLGPLLTKPAADEKKG
ncbi:hypothetical protein LINPERPRIM_LOCUS28183 [Linum perenne]